MWLVVGAVVSSTHDSHTAYLHLDVHQGHVCFITCNFFVFVKRSPQFKSSSMFECTVLSAKAFVTVNRSMILSFCSERHIK